MQALEACGNQNDWETDVDEEVQKQEEEEDWEPDVDEEMQKKVKEEMED